MLPISAIELKMVAAANLVELAALVGDTARATMLNALNAFFGHESNE